ncbi:hypothetical protein [Azospirillum argentinense]
MGLKLCGPGEWLIEKHGTKKRRSWHALHLGMDANTGRIVAATLPSAASMTPPRSAPCSLRLPGRWPL